ncbi:MAG: zinc ribbon domain-containing protein, partial [Candidatus Kariarchaeaceae archaeon]
MASIHCTECGTKNEMNASFCGTCGSKFSRTPQSQHQESPPGYQQTPLSYQQAHPGYVQAPPAYQQPQRGYQQTPQGYQQVPLGYQHGYLPGQRPPRTGWLTYVIVLSWIGIGLGLLGGIFFLFIWPPIGLVILAFAGLGIWLVRELAKYNNTARIIQLVLSGLSFLGSIFSLDVIG